MELDPPDWLLSVVDGAVDVEGGSEADLHPKIATSAKIHGINPRIK